MKTNWFQSVIDSIAERGRELLGLESTDHDNINIKNLCQQLLTGQGEASGIALSQAILSLYTTFDVSQKLAFFLILATEFNPDPERLKEASDRYLETKSAANLIELTAAVEAPRQEIFRRLNMAPNGTAMLVSLRADLLDAIKKQPELIAVEADLKHILASWFNHGFLRLRDIDWTSPAHILEKLTNYESVHEIQNWHDLRRRLMADRRCYAFFHPAMPDEPLIFIEVALVKGLSDNIADLIEPETPVLDLKQADTAIFYSINNTQVGLRGISFGNFLIKQVLTELTHELPQVKFSSTLSPMPLFASTLQKWLASSTDRKKTDAYSRVIMHHQSSIINIAAKYGLESTGTPIELFAKILEGYLKPACTELSELISDLALAYLTSTTPHNGKLIDPVAMFHLSNGARLERINICADMSAKGITASYGVMVNYLYDLADVESNHEAFATQGKVIMSETIRKRYKHILG